MLERANIEIRRGSEADEQWLFDLFKATMRDFIDAAWGWEELFQKEGFVTSLPAKNFQVLEYGGVAIGCLHISVKENYLVLDMILVEPEFQRQGFGSQLIALAFSDAKKTGLPIRLSVIKTNPAVAFHKDHGFEVVEEDEHSYRMQWSAT